MIGASLAFFFRALSFGSREDYGVRELFDCYVYRGVFFLGELLKLEAYGSGIFWMTDLSVGGLRSGALYSIQFGFMEGELNLRLAAPGPDDDASFCSIFYFTSLYS